MMRRHLATWGASLALAGGLVVSTGAASAAPRYRIGELELAVLGVSATVDPLEPVVPKNTAAAVRIVVKSGDSELSAADVARFVGGDFEVQGELSGPGLVQTVSLPQDLPADLRPSDPLLLPLPPIAIAGNYALSNIRLVSNGHVALDVVPADVTLRVIDQILVT